MSMNTAAYPRWEHAGSVSRLMIGPDFAVYEVKELPLIGGPLFVASALDTRELIGQFESNDFGVPQHALGDLRALQNAAMFSLVASTGRRSLSAEVGPVGSPAPPHRWAARPAR
jgi:hypothetical protein